MTWRQVVRYFNGVPAMADRLGIKRQAIYQWKGKIPILRAHEIEKMTGGELKFEDLPK